MTAATSQIRTLCPQKNHHTPTYMPTPTRALTNDYNDCKLIKLDSNDPKSPLVVMQEGYEPGDPTNRMRMFYLQRDGFWIDEIARSTLPDSEAGDVVFETSAEALQVLSGLFGKPLIRSLPVTDADAQAYIARVKSGSPEDLFRQFLARYRAAKGKS
jgi:hypothetical protein